MTRFRREEHARLQMAKAQPMRHMENLYATSAKEEAQSIVAAALSKLESKLAPANSFRFAYAA